MTRAFRRPWAHADWLVSVLASSVAPWVILVGLGACSDPPPRSQTVSDVHASDGNIFEFVVNVPDGATGDTDPDGTSSNKCDFPPDPPPGTYGASCNSADECDSGFCVETPNGKVCTTQCSGCCPTGFACLESSGPDPVSLCIPKMLYLCRPCLADTECVSTGNSGLCVSYGDAGRYCGGECSVASDCPTGYECKDAVGVQGKGKQCVRTDLTCTCSPKAIQQGASTTCAITSAAGSCPGTRKCLAAGLTACDAGTATPETCNGLDDNCNGLTDEPGAVGCETYWQDGDGDGYGLASTLGGKSECLCKPTDLFTSSTPTDCNDDNKDVSPGMAELCNDVDDNCNGQTDEGCDDDKDGFCDAQLVMVGSPAVCPKGTGDCNDNAVDVNPAATETCDNQDNNCNGATDEGCDTDKDGFCTAAMITLGTPAVCLKGGGDCNDDDKAIHPGATEICDDQDNDCNALTDEGCDDDVDLYCDATMTVVGKPAICPSGGNDCNVLDALVNPGVTEICGNGIDDNCDGVTDGGDNTTGCLIFYADQDQDGFGTFDSQCLCSGTGIYTASQAGDCNDMDPMVNPLHAEICNNGKDDNCDGQQNEPDAIGCEPFYIDLDSDGYGAGVSACLCGPDTTYTTKKGGDCDDADPKRNPAMTEVCNGIDDNCNGLTDEQDSIGCIVYYVDNDQDGYGDPAKGACLCAADATHVVTQGGDCDDNQPKANPGLKEVCDGFDNNCDGKIDEPNAIGCSEYYVDEDGDGWGDPAQAMCLCSPVAPYIVNQAKDCNDKNADIHPGATEVCNNVDDNCNGEVDEENSSGCSLYLLDQDGDSFGVAGDAKCLCKPTSPYTAITGGDCNDGNPAIKPGATELCDGQDNDCDGIIDNLGAVGCTTFYADNDGDGHGTLLAPTQCLCKAKGPYTSIVGDDCNDANAAIHPGAKETCNGLDDDCDNIIDPPNSIGCKPYYVDLDADGYGATIAWKCLCGASDVYTTLKSGDCNDQDPAVHPGAYESCNGIDDNCNGVTDSDSPEAKTYYFDGDSDGYGSAASAKYCSATGSFKVLVSGDCNDNNAAIHPGALEACNGVDDDCNGQTDELNATTMCGAVTNGTAACTGGKCTAACSQGWFDVDGNPANCECKADTNYGVGGGSCGGAIGLGALHDNSGGTANASGNIMPGESDWYHFTAVDDPDYAGCDRFKVDAKVMGGDNMFVIDMYRGGCAGGQQLCTNTTEEGWTVNFYGGAPYGPLHANGGSAGSYQPSPSPENAGECNCYAGGGVSGANACEDNSAEFYVRVYRAAGAPASCTYYSLVITNGL